MDVFGLTSAGLLGTMPSGSTRYTVNRRRRSRKNEAARLAAEEESNPRLNRQEFDPLETLRIRAQQERAGLDSTTFNRLSVHSDITNGHSNNAKEKTRIYNQNRNLFRKSTTGTVRSLNSLSGESSKTLRYPNYLPPGQASWINSIYKRSSPAGSVETLDSSTGATVAGEEYIGDALSLGDEDYAYQPISVRDQRLVGMVSDVESMLNNQLVEPISEQQQTPSSKLFRRRMNQYGTVKTLRGMSPNRYQTIDEDDRPPSIYGSVRSLSSTKSDSELYSKRRTRVLPMKNDILMKRPGEVTEMRNERFHRKEERFRVTPSGGIFRSSLDHNISVYFPMGAVDFPITVSMQVEKIRPDRLEDARLESATGLSNLLAVGHIVRLRQSHNIDFLHQVSITLPVPDCARRGGTLHVLTRDAGDVCTPCSAKYRSQHGYITLKAWHLAGKVAVFTKSRDKFKACDSMEEFLQLRS